MKALVEALRAQGGILADPVITALSHRYGKTPAQIVLRWHIELGNLVIPKSVTPSRIRENIDIFDFSLAATFALTRFRRSHVRPSSIRRSRAAFSLLERRSGGLLGRASRAKRPTGATRS